ncbi:hypothetical protein KQI84_08455 [bacterium]|nr:hypothetical protein [bacterium]
MAKNTRKQRGGRSKATAPSPPEERRQEGAQTDVDTKTWSQRLRDPWYVGANRWFFWAILALILVMGLVRWQTNASRSYWIDEIHSIRKGQLAVEAEGLEDLGEKYHQGFFATIGPLIGDGSSERQARTPAVVAIMLGIGFMAILGGLLGGRWMALSATIVGVIAPRALYHSGEIRYYAFLFMLGALGLLLLELCHRRKGAWALPLGGLTAIYAYTIHPASGPFMMMIGLAAFGFVAWDFATSIRPAFQNKKRNPATMIRAVWLGFMIATAVAAPVVMFSKVAEIWNAHFGAVLSGKATHAPNMKFTWDFLSRTFTHLYFSIPKRSFGTEVINFLWFGGLIVGPLLMFRRSRVLALFIPISFVLYFATFFFVPAEIGMAAKYMMAAVPGLLLLIATVPPEIGRLVATKSPRAGAWTFGVLMFGWIALNAQPAYLMIVKDVSNYRQTIEVAESYTQDTAPPTIFASSILLLGLDYYRQRLPLERRPIVRNAAGAGVPGILQGLASERGIMFAMINETASYRGRFIEAIEPYMKEVKELDSPVAPSYSVHIWRPRLDLIAVPGRILKLDRDAIEQLTGEGLDFLTPGPGGWRLKGAPENSKLFVNGEAMPTPVGDFLAAKETSMTLRLEAAEPIESLDLVPAPVDGMILCPGGLAWRVPVTPYSRPIMRSGVLAMNFKRSYWCEYALDVPEDAGGLVVVMEEAGKVSAAFEILIDDKPFAIVAGMMGAQQIIDGPYRRYVPLPEDAKGRRVRFRFTFLSETYIGDNEGTILGVGLVGSVPQDDNLFPRLILTPPPDWARGDFPRPQGDPFWGQVAVNANDLSKIEVHHDVEDPYMSVSLERDTPTMQIALPPFEPIPGSWIYCEYEAEQIAAPQHSLGMFATIYDKDGKDISLCGFTEGLQGQESDGWCRYGALMPVAAGAALVRFHWQIYRHPEENKPPTPEGSELRFRNFRIFAPEEVQRVTEP